MEEVEVILTADLVVFESRTAEKGLPVELAISPNVIVAVYGVAIAGFLEPFVLV